MQGARTLKSKTGLTFFLLGLFPPCCRCALLAAVVLMGKVVFVDVIFKIFVTMYVFLFTYVALARSGTDGFSVQNPGRRNIARFPMRNRWPGKAGGVNLVYYYRISPTSQLIGSVNYLRLCRA